MDDRKRTMVGIILMMMVAIIPSILFSPDQQPPVESPPASTPAPAVSAPSGLDIPEPATSSDMEPGPLDQALPAVPVLGAAPVSGQSVTVRSDLYEYVFSSVGARITEATMLEHPSLIPGDDRRPGQLIPEASNFLTYGLLFGNDTVSLAEWVFEPSQSDVQVGPGGAQLDWVARRGQVTVSLTQSFSSDTYLFDVTGRITGIGTETPLVLINLGPRLRMIEADARTEARNIGVVTKTDKTESTRFDQFEGAGFEQLDGPFEWVAVKSKFFLAAILAIDEGNPRFGGGITRGTGDDNENGVFVTASLPVTGNAFHHSVYFGPQEMQYLLEIGHDLEDANPYGWIFRPIIRPVAKWIVLALRWGHDTLNLQYGWLLILFGVVVRLAIWPLNAKALRSQMKMQAVQPELEEIKKRYPDNPQKVQEETMKIFREKGVNPVGGCLPMLLPLPIFLAFFFVFMNAIELRGVPFWWLPDLSAKDPYYIVPLVMGGSMFLTTKLSQMGAPPNPQTKIFLFVMPIMMTAFLLNFAAGLNLYYATQNLASVPQQWLIGRERRKVREGSG